MSTTHLVLSLPTRKRVATTATVALVGVTYFAGMLVTLHFLHLDHNPVRQVTSYYAVGPHGFLMTSAYFGMSMATWALVAGLSRGVSPPARSRVGLGFLGIWGVGCLIAMVFPLDPEGMPTTLSGTIHRINGPLAFLGLTVGVLVVSRRFKHDDAWRPVHRPALMLSLIVLAMVFATVLNVVTGAGLAGLTQRIALVAIVSWFLLTASRLRTFANEAALTSQTSREGR